MSSIPWADPSELPDEMRPPVVQLQREPDIAYIRQYDGVTIDPKTGLLFQNGQALWGSTDFPQRERTPLFHKHLFRPKKQLDRAIVLHHAFDNNYFHFLLIIAPKLWLAQCHGIDPHVPALVSSRLAAQPFFEDAVNLGLFGDREIIVQGKTEVVAARRAYTVRSHEYDLEAAEWICDKLGAHPLESSNNRIYIHRGSKAANARHIRNQSELNQLLTRYGITFFDPQEHSLRQQIDTVAQASLIIGPHGAGLTNMMFRRKAPCRVIELLNPSWCGAHYYLMSKQRGYEYHWVLNKNEGASKQASADADLEAIEKLLCAMT
ncbi:MAG: glycosyltransferase family 61 protein [Pseudomonadota bacterium]